MSKTIKLTDTTYAELVKFQRPRETLSEIVDRLLVIYALMVKVEPELRASHEFTEWQREQTNKALPTD